MSNDYPKFVEPDIIDSIIYRYKSAVLDNRHDFGLTAADLIKIEGQLRLAYAPYIYKNDSFMVGIPPPLQPQQTPHQELNIKDEDDFLLQIGIKKETIFPSSSGDKNVGMRTIVQYTPTEPKTQANTCKSYAG